MKHRPLKLVSDPDTFNSDMRILPAGPLKGGRRSQGGTVKISVIKRKAALAELEAAGKPVPNPLRADPTRTGKMRAAMAAHLDRQFAELGRRLAVLGEEDAWGTELARNTEHDPKTGRFVSMVPAEDVEDPKFDLDLGAVADIVEKLDDGKTLAPAKGKRNEETGKVELDDGFHRTAARKFRGESHIPVVLNRSDQESFPVVFQRHDWDCGPACLEAVCRWLGRECPEAVEASPAHGMNPLAMAEALRAAGVDAQLGHFASPLDLTYNANPNHDEKGRFAAGAGSKVTDSAAFKVWFSDSKVVDEKGEPLVVYHGTDAGDFDEFAPNSYFSEHPGEASAYTSWKELEAAEKGAWKNVEASGAEEFAGKRLPNVGIISDARELRKEFGDTWATDQGVIQFQKDGTYKFFSDLKIEPDTYDNDTVRVVEGDNRAAYRELVEDREEMLKEQFPGGKGGRVYPVYLSIKNPKYLSAYEGNKFSKKLEADPKEVKARMEELEKQGHDGIVTESDEASFFSDMATSLGGVPKQWIPFHPHQIKSIHAKEFDRSSGNVLNSSNGSVYLCLIQHEKPACYRNGHWVVVTEQGHGMVRVMCPLRGFRWLTAARFNERWHDRDSAGREWIRCGIEVRRVTENAEREYERDERGRFAGTGELREEVIREGKAVKWKGEHGYISVRLDTDDGIPSVEKVYVDENYRRQGIATSMYKAMLEKYGAIASATVTWTSSDAAKIWEKIGGVKQSDGRYVVRLTENVSNEEVDAAAAKADPSPTPAQIESGNYKHGHVVFAGLPVTIETAAGVKRKPWHDKPLAAHYGYVKRTLSAADGDHVDVFLGPNPDSDRVFVVDQLKGDAFDEHKCMLGWDDAASAKAAYLASYPDGWDGLGGMRELSLEDFRLWLEEGDTSRPIAEWPDLEGEGRKLVEGLLAAHDAVRNCGGKGGTMGPCPQAAGLNLVPEEGETSTKWESEHGFIRVRYKTDSGIPSVERIYVKPEHRGKGIAGEMYKAMAQHYGSITSSEGGNTNADAAKVWKKIGGKTDHGIKGVDFLLTANCGGRGGTMGPCPKGQDFTRAAKVRAAVAHWQAKAGGALGAFIDRIPGGKFLKGQLAAKMEWMRKRYGEKTMKRIVAGATALSWALAIGGAAHGVVIYAPIGGLTAVGAVLAEAHLQGKRLVGKVTGNTFCPTGEGGGVDPTCSPNKSDDGGVKTTEGMENDLPLDEYNQRRGTKEIGAITVKAYRVGALEDRANRGGVFFSGDADTVKSYASLHEGHVVKEYVVKLKNVILAGHQNDLCKLFFKKTYGEITDTIGSRYLGKSAHERSAAFDRKINAEAKKRGYDGIIYTAPAAPAKTEVVVIGKKWDQSITANTRFAFHSSPEKVKAFQRWLQLQVAQLLLSQDEDELWRRYAEEGYKKGAGRAFDDANAASIGQWGKVHDFYRGTREQFLKSSFGQPVSIERIKVLAGRSFDEMRNVTHDMATRMSRTLTDGLVQGKHSREVAKDLVREVGLGKARARMVAATELIRAHNHGQLDSFKAQGMDKVGVQAEVLTARDNIVCPICQALEGRIFDIDEAYGILPAHVSCRCCFKPALGKALSKLGIRPITNRRCYSWPVRNTEQERDEKGRFAYVGTRSSHLLHHAKYGLVPGLTSYKDSYSKYDDGKHVFISDDEDFVRRHYGDGTVMRFPMPEDAKQDQNQFGRLLASQLVVKRGIPPGELEVKTEGGWEPIHKHPLTVSHASQEETRNERDVSAEPRDAEGRWTSGGDVPAALRPKLKDGLYPKSAELHEAAADPAKLDALFKRVRPADRGKLTRLMEQLRKDDETPQNKGVGEGKPVDADAVHETLKMLVGSVNLTPLPKVRAALAHLSREEQDAALHELHRRGKIGFSGWEGRQGIEPEEKDALLDVGGQKMGHVYLRGVTNAEEEPRDEKGRWTSEGGAGKEAGVAGVTDVKGKTERGIIADIAVRVEHVGFSDEVVRDSEVDEDDQDKIEEAMTAEEREEMEAAMEAMKDSALDSYMDGYESQGWEPSRSDYRDLDYASGDVADKVRELIDEHVEDEEEAGRLKGLVSDWEQQQEEDGSDAARSANRELVDELPDDAKTAFGAWWDEKDKELEKRKEEAEQEEQDEYRKQMDYDDDSSENRREYLRQFFLDNEDRFKGAEAKDNTWQKDGDGDDVLTFETEAGNRYDLSIYSKQLLGQQVHEFVFSDASGSFGVTGRGGAKEVFSKVTAGVVAWMKHERPAVLSFTAAEESRRGLYDKLVKTVAKVLPEYSAIAIEGEDKNTPKRYAVVKREQRNELLKLVESQKVAGVKASILVNVLTPQLADELYPSFQEDRTANTFCPTGEGGGVDPSCGKSSSYPTAGDKLAELKAASPHVEAVLNRMSEEAVKRFVKHVAAVKVYASEAELTKVDQQLSQRPLKAGEVTSGFCWPEGDKVTIHLAVGGDDEWERGTAAHEMGHALDGPRQFLSRSDEWKDAWMSEIDRKGDPLTSYARLKPAEGFAEFCRLLWTGDGAAAKAFPKCLTFFSFRGLT